jgi:hypothetical protein
MAIYDGPMPPGYTPWGSSHLSSAMVAWAQEINHQTGMSHYGEIFHTVIEGVPVAGRVEHHAFTYNSRGEQVPCPADGCHGVTLYHPPPGTVPAQPVVQHTPAPAVDNSTRIISFLLLGTALFSASLAAASAFFKARAPHKAAAHDEEEE